MNEEKIKTSKNIDIDLIMLAMEKHGFLPENDHQKKLFRHMLNMVEDTSGLLEMMAYYNN